MSGGSCKTLQKGGILSEAGISGEHRLRVPSEESGNDYAGGNKRRDYGNTEVIKTAF